MNKKLVWVGIVAFSLISVGIVYAYDILNSVEQGKSEEASAPIAACKCFESSELRMDRGQSIKPNLKKTYSMSLFACQCGGVSCVVHSQAIACVK